MYYEKLEGPRPRLVRLLHVRRLLLHSVRSLNRKTISQICPFHRIVIVHAISVIVDLVRSLNRLLTRTVPRLPTHSLHECHCFVCSLIFSLGLSHPFGLSSHLSLASPGMASPRPVSPHLACSSISAQGKAATRMQSRMPGSAQAPGVREKGKAVRFRANFPQQAVHL